MASILKVDTIQDQSGNNIINENADTITIGASGDTITVPTGATLTNNGTLGAGMGKVLQVVFGSTTTQVNNNTTSFTDTGLSASITPSSTSNKVLIIVNQSHKTQDPSALSAGSAIKLLRGSTDIYGDVRPYEIFMQIGSSTNIQFYDRYNLNYLDSPSTTSATTYKTQGRAYQSGDELVVQPEDIESTIILMEIAG